jgi:hypothetical protein
MPTSVVVISKFKMSASVVVISNEICFMNLFPFEAETLINLKVPEYNFKA